MHRRALLAVLAATAAPARADPNPALNALLTDQPGWTAEELADAAEYPEGTIYGRTYKQPDQQARLLLFVGRIADAVASTISDTPDTTLLEIPSVRETVRGYRLWASYDTTGVLKQAGVVIVSGGPDHPERSAFLSVRGTDLFYLDAVDLLKRLDWDRIKAAVEGT